MADYVSINVPREVLHATRMTLAEIKTELALTLFQQGKLSFGKARELAEMSFWTFQQLLGARDISIHYDLEDLDGDIETLKTLGRL